MPRKEFGILGPLDVRDGDAAVALPPGKPRALLALLLLHAREVMSKYQLVEGLWGERAPASAVKNVQIYISHLRKAVGDDAITTVGQGYAVQIEPDQLDLHRFERLLAGGRERLAAGDARAAADNLGEALSLWRGPPLAEFGDEPFAQGEAERLEELRLAALETRIEADIALGRHDTVIPELTALVRQEPFRERLRGQLMLALYRAGRQGEALEAYREGRRTLVAELGLEPATALQELERAILTQDAALDPPVQPGFGRVYRRRRLLLLATSAIAAAAAAAAIGLSGGGGRADLRGVRANSVGVIDPSTNRIVAQVPVGAAPTRVSVGLGSVWVVNSDDQTVSRLDPKARVVVRTIPIEGRPTDVAAGGGRVWVLFARLAAFTMVVGRIDPSLNAVVESVPIGTSGSATFADRLATAPGMLWASSEGTVVRVGPGTMRVKARVAIPAGTGSSILTVPDIGAAGGSVWVASYAGVTRIDSRTASVAGTISTAGHGPGPQPAPTALAVGEGAVWVANTPRDRLSAPCPLCDSGLPGSVIRIDPSNDTVTATIPVGRSPFSIAVGEGAVWVANRTSRSVSRIDPRSNKVVATILLHNRPEGIAVGNGAVWVTVD